MVAGKTWGTLPREHHSTWHGLFCDEISTTGKLLSCDDMWGWSMIKNWILQYKVIFNQSTGHSSMECAVSSKNSQFCNLHNVVIDFSKIHNDGSSRHFSNGFVTLYNNITSLSQHSISSPIPMGFDITNKPFDPLICDSYEERPTFIMSHDDIYNLGHNMNDVMIVWAMMQLYKYNSYSKHTAGNDKKLFINIDGVRRGGPAGGHHKIMNVSEPDFYGPFFDYYINWFDSVERPLTYKHNPRVCFKQVYFQPFPGVPFVWQDWSKINKCSVTGPSPLIQSFSIDVRRHFEQRLYSNSKSKVQHSELYNQLNSNVNLSNNVSPTINILFEHRTVRKNQMASVSRIIHNIEDIITNIRQNISRSHMNVNVHVVRFNEHSFMEQMSIMYKANILIGK
jgi:hypothetical protein